jgi:hypothetical protein
MNGGLDYIIPFSKMGIYNIYISLRNIIYENGYINPYEIHHIESVREWV